MFWRNECLQGLSIFLALLLPRKFFTTRTNALHLKTHSIPKSKFRKILVENTTIIAHEIDKLRLQIQQINKSIELILKIATMFWNACSFCFCLFLVFICWASSICSHSLFIFCAIIVVFSTTIFRNLDLGIEWVLRYKAIVLESLRCIVCRLERVVVTRWIFC